jgi:hypothetical protein
MPPSSPAVEPQLATLESLEPHARWSQLTDAPLSGLALAREAGRILVWDDAHNILVLDVAGNRLISTRAPVPLHLATISDDGTQIVVTSREGDIWWLGAKLEPRVHRPGVRHMIGLALSPQGEYLAVGCSDSHTRLYDWHGRPITNLLTHRPLKHMAFLAGQSCLVAAAEYGLVGCYELDGQPRWQDALWSSAGHLATSGEGYAIFIACFSHGLQRYGWDGTNEGAYHLSGSVTRASVDYDGKIIAAATLEGALAVLNAAGHVLWRQTFLHPVKDVVLDASGRLLLYGLQTGEHTLLDLAPVAAQQPKQRAPARTAPAAAGTASPVELSAASPSGPASASRSATSQLREPTWKLPAFESDSQAETAVLALAADPIRIVVFSSRKRFDVFDEKGERLHTSDVISGVGRFLEGATGLVVAATDRELAVYDVATNTSTRFADRLVQISHLVIDPLVGEIAVVEERDRIERFDLAGRRRWLEQLHWNVESLAVGADRTSAITTDQGLLLVFDSEGRRIGEFRTRQPEPLALVRLGPQWITLAGKSQLVRGHQLSGGVEWETLLPTEAWRLVRVGKRVVARAAGGRSYLLDARGQLLLDATELPHEATLFSDPFDDPLALFWRVGNVMVTELSGRVRWRHLSAESLGPVAAGPPGVVCALGRELTFFAA